MGLRFQNMFFLLTKKIIWCLYVYTTSAYHFMRLIQLLHHVLLQIPTLQNRNNRHSASITSLLWRFNEFSIVHYLE